MDGTHREDAASSAQPTPTAIPPPAAWAFSGDSGWALPPLWRPSGTHLCCFIKHREKSYYALFSTSASVHVRLSGAQLQVLVYPGFSHGSVLRNAEAFPQLGHPAAADAPNRAAAARNAGAGPMPLPEPNQNAAQVAGQKALFANAVAGTPLGLFGFTAPHSVPTVCSSPLMLPTS